MDVFIRQSADYPTVKVNVDRVRANEAGLTQRDVASSLLISLSSSGQVAPNQWLNPTNGVNYQVAVQTPTYKVDSFDAMQRTPITAPGAAGSQQLLANLAVLQRATSPAIESHYDVQPVIDVYAAPDRRDLGGFAADVSRVIEQVRPTLPRGTTIDLRGQVDTMRTSFTRLGLGMIFAVVLVYLVMAVNFQSWSDPFIILMALPGAMAGMLWMLYLTGTTLNVPSLMGAIMCIGVATANSILLVTFANDVRVEGYNATQAALSAGFTRIRPVIMTALAMIIGMVPMALAMGEGGEQNAPLGRAVIGGLLLATPTTLLFVPIVYSLVRKEAPVDLDRRISAEAGELSSCSIGRSHGSHARHLAAVRGDRAGARQDLAQVHLVWGARAVPAGGGSVYRRLSSETTHHGTARMPLPQNREASRRSSIQPRSNVRRKPANSCCRATSLRSRRRTSSREPPAT